MECLPHLHHAARRFDLLAVGWVTRDVGSSSPNRILSRSNVAGFSIATGTPCAAHDSRTQMRASRRSASRSYPGRPMQPILVMMSHAGVTTQDFLGASGPPLMAVRAARLTLLAWTSGGGLR